MKRLTIEFLFVFLWAVTGAAIEGNVCRKFYENSNKVTETNGFKIFTSRFELRPLDKDDFAAATKLIFDPSVGDMSGDFQIYKKFNIGRLNYAKYMARIEFYARSRLTFQGLKQKSTGKNINLSFGIFEKGKLIGMCGLFSGAQGASTLEIENKKIFSISYHLFPHVWGKGIASEVGLRLIDYAFRNMDADLVHGQALKSNIGSNRVLEKIGLVPFSQNDPLYNHFIIERPFQ
mgnify:CR=1 FL=1|tara:strand:+ start:332 stop:1030 length:699 start_codon:yes stop_codon:yes gene_type:complete